MFYFLFCSHCCRSWAETCEQFVLWTICLLIWKRDGFLSYKKALKTCSSKTRCTDSKACQNSVRIPTSIKKHGKDSMGLWNVRAYSANGKKLRSKNITPQNTWDPKTWLASSKPNRNCTKWLYFLSLFIISSESWNSSASVSIKVPGGREGDASVYLKTKVFQVDFQTCCAKRLWKIPAVGIWDGVTVTSWLRGKCVKIQKPWSVIKTYRGK